MMEWAIFAVVCLSFLASVCALVTVHRWRQRMTSDTLPVPEIKCPSCGARIRATMAKRQRRASTADRMQWAGPWPVQRRDDGNQPPR